jgi:hypothetical protein
MTGTPPYPAGYGAPTQGNGPPPPPSGGGYLPPPSPQFAPNAGSRRRGRGLLAAGVVLAVILATAALVVSIISASRSPEPAPPAQTPKAEPQQLFVDDVDRALCQAIGPLMKESDEKSNAFIASGLAGSPERSAAIPKFKADILDWATRTQQVINEHAEPPRYLTRTLQNYVDGMLLYSENIYPNMGVDSFDKATYDSAVVYYGGPLATCYKLGVRW